MKYLFSRSLILCAATLVSLFIATQSAWGADAVVSGPIYANATANYYPQDILRAGNGEQCLDVTENTQATLSETFLDGTVLYSIDSDGRPITTENKGKFTSVTINDVATPCINDQRILVKFPKDVKSVTIYGYNKSDRTFEGVSISETAAKDSYTNLAYTGGTNSATKPNYTFEITLSNTEVANKYLWFKFSDAISIYRICYTPASSSYTITYNTNGGEAIAQETNATALPASLPTTTKLGYDFAGWYTDEALTIPAVAGAPISDNTTLYANWTPTIYNITYEGLEGATNSGSNPATYTIESETITFVVPGERAGYTFTGWTPASIAEGSTGNKIVTAQWAEIPYTFSYGVKGQPYTTRDFTRVSTTNEWRITDFVFPDVNTNQVCYVGKGGFWYNDALGTASAKSADLYFYNMPLALLQNTSCTVKTLGWSKDNSNGHKAIGTLRIFDNYKDDNLYVGFIPKGYGLMHGAKGGEWSGLAFAPVDANDIEWTTDPVTLTAEMLEGTYKYYVGLLTSEGGYTYCGNSETSVLNTMGSYANDDWGSNLGTFTAGQKGVFRIWANSCDDNNTKNFVCHFLPYYHLTYKANYPAGAGEQPADTQSEDYSAESNNTITLPNAPTAPAGYTFRGWYDADTDGNLVGAAGADYTFNKPSANITLYAQWKEIVEPACMDIAAATITNDAKSMTASKGEVNVQGADQADGYLKLLGDKWASNYIQLTAANGSAPFAAGDVLYVTCYNKGNSAADRGFKIGTTTNVTCTLNIAATSEGVVTYTLTSEDIETDGTIKLTRTDADDRYKSVRVERCSSTPAPVVEKKAPHRNYQIAKRTLRPYTSVTHYPLFDVTPKATAEYTGDKKWVASYTIHAANTGIITAGKANIDWVREDAKKGDTITLGANYEALRNWLRTNNFSEENVGDTIMLTMRAVNACDQPDDATADSIPIILTNKYSLAYIVTGNTTTRKFYDITAADINDPLYTNLSAQYNVTPVSAYATYDYTNYEPYDLLLLTDYPKATGENAQPDYVNALADLVDRKPILSLKAHMSKLSNWSAKGFTSDPVVPGDGTKEQAQTTLTVLCFSHDMFEGAKWDNDNADDRTLTILDNVYKDGNTYKGIQGFLAINSANFVNIATVYDAKGNRNLVACCERQDVTAARFIMLSINQGATNFINPAGQDAIDKLLKYLLWTEATNVSDCSLTFDNGEGNCTDCSEGKREFTKGNKTYTSGDHQWNNPANWNAKAIPTQLQNVRIEANCIVSGNTYGAGNVRIKEGKNLTIAPNGGLASVGQFAYYSGEKWNEPKPIPNTGYIIVQANKDSTGMLMHSHTDQLAATVQMYSPARYDGKLDNGNPKRLWSYVAIPVEEGTVPDIFNGAYTYLWQETTTGWIRYRDGSTFDAFDAIALSQPEPMIFTFAGNLALAQKYEIELTNTKNGMGGMNLIGNSWTAPIQITKLEDTDFGTGLEATVYIYSTGRDPQNGPAAIEGELAAGYWTAIPIETAKGTGWKGPKVIPAMQAFEVNFDANASATSATLTLDYNTIVRASGVDYSTLNQKLYAPGRNSTAEILQPDPSAPAPYEPTMLRIRVADTAACYNLHLLQGERFSEGFDNGWDGFYIGTDGRAPGLCALTTAGEMQVSAQPEIDNTTLVFTPGKSDTYTFSFCLTETEEEPLAAPLYLNDIQLRKSCPIDDNVTYTFRYSENDMENRFVISHIAFEEQDTPTGIANLATVDQQLMLNNPAREALTIRVYDPAGRLCSEMSTREAMLQITLPEPQGVYMIHIIGEQTEILRKIVQ